MATAKSYTGKQIIVLEGLEPVRKRPAMYIGSTSIAGVYHIIKEIVDNSIDEALAGFAKHIWVTINKDNSFTIVDDGRGIPIDKVPKYGISALEIVMTKLHAGGKFVPRTIQLEGKNIIQTANCPDKPCIPGLAALPNYSNETK